MLAAVADRYPARQYINVDDKLRILTMVKRIWGHRVTTVFARQGHDALLPGVLAAYPAADLTIQRLGDLLAGDLSTLLSRHAAGRPTLEQP